MMQAMQSFITGQKGIWVGASLSAPPDQRWTFITGEIFEFIKWAPGQPDTGDLPQPVLQIRRGPEGKYGYHNSASSSDQVGALLLEWSALSRRNMPGKDARNLANVEEWLAAARGKVAATEKESYERFQRSNERNLDNFLKDLEKETELARRFSNEAKEYIDAFTRGIRESGSIPGELGSERARQFIGSVHEDALRKQTSLWEGYQEQFQDAKARYLETLRAEIIRRTKQADKKAAAFLDRERIAASMDPHFRAIIGGGYPPVPDE